MAKIVRNIVEYGFRALSAYSLCITLLVLAFYGAAWIAKLAVKTKRIDTDEIRNLIVIFLSFTLVFKILDYFLV